jgi:hypothetical protein
MTATCVAADGWSEFRGLCGTTSAGERQDGFLWPRCFMQNTDSRSPCTRGAPRSWRICNCACSKSTSGGQALAHAIQAAALPVHAAREHHEVARHLRKNGTPHTHATRSEYSAHGAHHRDRRLCTGSARFRSKLHVRAGRPNLKACGLQEAQGSRQRSGADEYSLPPSTRTATDGYALQPPVVNW